MEKTRSSALICPRCGYEYTPPVAFMPSPALSQRPDRSAERSRRSPERNEGEGSAEGPALSAVEGMQCPLCAGRWEAWELLFSPIPLPKIREQVAAWLGNLPHPCVFEIGASSDGVRLRLFTPPGCGQGAVSAWAAMLHQQLRWKQIDEKMILASGVVYALSAESNIPALVQQSGDLLLEIGGRLMSAEHSPALVQVQALSQAAVTCFGKTALRLWLVGRDEKLQAKLRALSAYSYGTESGVGSNAPNPWGLRLGLLRGVLMFGGLIAAVSGGLIGAGWTSPGLGVIGILGGMTLAAAAGLGMLEWMRLRSIPKEMLERRTQEPLLKVAITLRSDSPQSFSLVDGPTRWRVIDPGSEWPSVRAFAMPLPVGEIAALVCPPETGEISGVIAQTSRQDVPSPTPSLPLTQATFRIGKGSAGGETVGVDPDGHGVVVGGTRTGKSSLIFALLKQLIERGPDAPGIFLVDPHLSLADALLQAIDELPPDLRAEGIRRLRIITPDQPEVVPLNLLAVPEFSWAGNAIVQVGRRIWDDYWGPRMQAALLGLFRLAHAWNMNHPDERMGLLHTVFAAFNVDWRHDTLSLLPPVDRMGALALDALLGQMKTSYGGNWGQGWVTEVISPVLSKVMAMELSPWLFAALHQNRFVDLETWIKEKAWVVLRLPSGEMGREGARLTAGVVYNVFDAAYRRTTLYQPIPFYFVIDEAQEIGTGMRLEAMLSEGAKFGARMFVLVQSLSMMRHVEGYEPVVQALLANTSTQAFFSPDPEDAELIRAALSSDLRYGDTTLDLPSLQCWLRARIEGRWQPPTMISVDPLTSADPTLVQRLVREVIAAHPADYASPEGWQENAVRALQGMVPPTHQFLLSELLATNASPWGAATTAAQAMSDIQQPPTDKRRLGF